MTFGSHMYGLNGPTSDRDYKGIFLPDERELLLANYPKSINKPARKDGMKNGVDDVDREWYSLHYFVKMACEGQTTALDMLHARVEHLVSRSDAWFDLVFYRKKFYTKNLQSFVGYAKRQAAKYGIKGSRLATANEMVRLLRCLPDYERLEKARHLLPFLEHMSADDEFITICGMKFGWRTYIPYVRDRVELFVERYGERARLAEANQGVDWKAISHAYRAAYQCRAIFEYGDYEYPLRETEHLLQIKNGFVHAKEAIAQLDELCTQVETLAEKSTLPIEADKTYWDDWLYNTCLISLENPRLLDVVVEG